MENNINFQEQLFEAWSNRQRLNIAQLRSMGNASGLPENDKYIFEQAELAWTEWYRSIINITKSFGKQPEPKEVFAKIIDFYTNVQPSFTTRDSTRLIYQQFSTPAPLGWLLGQFCWMRLKEKDHFKIKVFEPSAGNGLLTVYFPHRSITVNELDPVRHANLSTEAYANIYQLDAQERFPENFRQKFDIVLTNPPFGKLGEVNREFTWPFKKIDHVMVAIALETIKDDGKAGIIIGDHTEFDPKTGQIKNNRAFFNWLHRYYHVIDCININSDTMYGKQGTTYPVRMILIDGRKQQPVGAAPNAEESPQYAQLAVNWQDLYDRVRLAWMQPRSLEIPEQLSIYQKQLLIANT